MSVEVAPDDVPRPGEVIANKYVVGRVLGVGGMGVVVAARHIQLQQPVAVKFMLGSKRPAAEAVARFLREARTAGRLRSEHVVRVHDVGTTERGEPFMVMELLDGRDLGARLAEHGPLPIHEAVDCVLQASDAIAEAHACGVVHRDLKPSNLFLTTRSDGSPCVKVLDFGISKSTRVAGPAASLTSSAAVMGSPLYMSPEQVRSSKNVDERTDVWSLGVILYELLTGRPPFAGETFSAICVTIATEAPTPMPNWRSDVPPELEATILHCLQKDPGQRMPSVARLAEALKAFGSPAMQHLVDRIARHAAERTVGPDDLTTTEMAPTAPASAWGRTHKGARGRRTAFLGAVGGVAVAAIVGSALLLARGRSGPAVSATAASPSHAATATPPAALPSTPAPASSAASTPSATSEPPSPLLHPHPPAPIASHRRPRLGHAPAVTPGAAAPRAAPGGAPSVAGASSSPASGGDPESALEGRK